MNLEALKQICFSLSSIHIVELLNRTLGTTFLSGLENLVVWSDLWGDRSLSHLVISSNCVAGLKHRFPKRHTQTPADHWDLSPKRSQSLLTLMLKYPALTQKIIIVLHLWHLYRVNSFVPHQAKLYKTTNVYIIRGMVFWLHSQWPIVKTVAT